MLYQPCIRLSLIITELVIPIMIIKDYRGNNINDSGSKSNIIFEVNDLWTS